MPHYKKITAPEFEVSEIGCSTKLQDILDQGLVKIPEVKRENQTKIFY